MAFDAQQAGKARIAVVAVLAVVVIALVAVLATQLARPAATGDAAEPTAQESTQTSAQDSADTAKDDAASADTHTVEDIDAQYGTTVQSLQAQYDADPSNPSALYNLANAYFDWGLAVLNHAVDADDEAHATEVFREAIARYDTYLEANPGAKSVTVDRAICVFYTGDHAAAITALEDLLAEDETFAPAWANLGMFYENDGRVEDARDAYQRALDNAGADDPYNVTDYAEQRLAALASS